MKAGTPVINKSGTIGIESGTIGIVSSPTVVNGKVFVMFVGGSYEVICKVDDLSPVTIGIVPTA